MLVSLRQYARHRKARGLPGATVSAVQKALATGRIVLVDGGIEVDAADAQWHANTDGVKQANALWHGTFQSPQRPAADVPLSGEAAVGARAVIQCVRRHAPVHALAAALGAPPGVIAAADVLLDYVLTNGAAKLMPGLGEGTGSWPAIPRPDMQVIAKKAGLRYDAKAWEAAGERFVEQVDEFFAPRT